ncbi:peptide chain release factor 1 [Candidatus Kuenenbacteria bacterium HGW-Kuenenbacteria-1]|uniref:Peptide chain release factor 1 n=1 Tax=Candidatus Kuenenbacteria bacterium HGW-Kuenenbacteria-1 TaxID=2013812 RepID=A0A2N1UN26_9BACT|nr:MAG: peptide chain release factor 1 [Candidatus Kuenenbacteria bacterium HGW-Kuenenbacteria-1]
MLKQLPKFQKSLNELEQQLQDPSIFNDIQKIKEISKKFNENKEIVENFKKLESLEKDINQNKEFLKTEIDQEMIELIQQELKNLEINKINLEIKIKILLSPKDPLDEKNIIMEIRAGVGGNEAELFAADLFRMYFRFAERKKWKTNLIDSNKTEIGGFKEITFEITGNNVYSQLKYEIGVHRVQRVPETEKQGRIHTSTATVAVLPEAEEIDIKIDPKDLRIDVFCSGGHGGQNVNKVSTAVRITHLPTNIVVSCQNERSQPQNKEKAFTVLRSRLLVLEQEKKQKTLTTERKSQVGTGDRSEKNRTYNFPQDRITDHRIKKSWHNIANILDGDLDQIIIELTNQSLNNCL